MDHISVNKRSYFNYSGRRSRQMHHGLQAASPEHTRIKPAPLVRFSVGACIATMFQYLPRRRWRCD